VHAVAAIFKTINDQRMVSFCQLVHAEIKEIRRIVLGRIPDIITGDIAGNAIGENRTAPAKIRRCAERPASGSGGIERNGRFPGEIAGAAK
jgi:hypothetical protein